MIDNRREYLKQYPNEEDPYNWTGYFRYEDIDDFVSKRQGKKVLMKEDLTKTDTGTLYYE